MATLGGLKHHFGDGADEYRWCRPGPPLPIITTPSTPPDYVAKKEAETYSEAVRTMRNGLAAILEKYAAIGPPPDSATDGRASVQVPTKAFISHGGFKPSLQHAQDFLRAMGVEPVVVERKASEGREVHGNVDKHRKDCQFAIVLCTRDLQDAAGDWLPSGSVMMEAGELRQQFGPHLIFLKEEGVKLPAMGGTIVYEPFTENEIGPAFRKIVTELHAWGWLRVQPEALKRGGGDLNSSPSVTSDEANGVAPDPDFSAAEEGIWDWLAQVEESLSAATEETTDMTQAVTSMTESLAARTERLQRLVDQGDATGVRSALAATATTILEYSKGA